MTRTARNRFVAWLGIAAMWLAIVAPVISQTLAARNASDRPFAALCTADAPAVSEVKASHVDAARLIVAASGDERAGHHDAASHFDACSYCGLLAHNLPIARNVALDVSIVERVTRVATRAAVVAPVAKSFNAASPRAPPVVS